MKAKISRTEKEIRAKIKELIGDSSNFTSDNYGSEAADNGFHEVYFSEWSSQETLEKFVEWLYGKKIFKDK
jgi:hypothetical protein